MRPVDVFGAGLVASAVTGALSALGFLVVGWLFGGNEDGLDLTGLIEVLGLWLAAAVWFGLGAGLVLGLVPAAIASFAWPTAVHAVGEVRAVRRLTAVVTVVVLAELLAAAFGTADPVSDGAWALPWALLVTALAAVVAWSHLHWTRRMAHRRLERNTLRF